MRLDLQPHPDTVSNAVEAFDVDLARTYEDSRLFIRFRVRIGCDQIDLPDSKWFNGARADNLWQHTCFEIFVRPYPGALYYEFNLSPSADWAAYRFESYRKSMMNAELAVASIVDRRKRNSYQLAAQIEGLPPNAKWNLGLSAVIEEKSGAKSYWALAHPPGAPDFHHPDCFTLELPAAGEG